ncbi:MAG: DNA-protecting protein DprA [Thermoplasmata archaeon]|nr:DNA-protecting protein DprA [Thermoplasmata archaeon]
MPKEVVFGRSDGTDIPLVPEAYCAFCSKPKVLKVMNREDYFWVWLNESLYKKRLSIPKIHTILQSSEPLLKPSFEGVSKWLDASSMKGLNREWEGVDHHAFEEILDRCLKRGVRLLTFREEGYPRLLKEIPDPPLALFVKGALTEFSRCVAVAGTRNPSAEGHRMARECGRALAERGYTVVSGLARGIDTEAHLGALDVGGKTVAVLAGDVEKICPPENKRITEDIMRNGALVSETPPHTSIEKPRFVRRNRITSGMSHCLVVIESPGRGGTSTQVDQALREGRRIFVMMAEKRHSDLREGFEEYLSRGAEPFREIHELMSCVEMAVSNKGKMIRVERQEPLDAFLQ